MQLTFKGDNLIRRRSEGKASYRYVDLIYVDKGIDKVAFFFPLLSSLSIFQELLLTSSLPVSFLLPRTFSVLGLILTAAPAPSHRAASMRSTCGCGLGEPCYNTLFSTIWKKMPCAGVKTCATSFISDFHRAFLLSVCSGPWPAWLFRQLPCHGSAASSISSCDDAPRVIAETKQATGNIDLGSQVSAALPDVKWGSCFILFFRLFYSFWYIFLKHHTANTLYCSLAFSCIFPVVAA